MISRDSPPSLELCSRPVVESGGVRDRPPERSLRKPRLLGASSPDPVGTRRTDSAWLWPLGPTLPFTLGCFSQIRKKPGGTHFFDIYL